METIKENWRWIALILFIIFVVHLPFIHGLFGDFISPECMEGVLGIMVC